MRTQLLCTFAHKSNLDIVTEYIKQNFIISEKRIFVFSNYDRRNELYCTFNAENNGHRGKNTISIHRKKDSNTLYTVNALNAVIKNLNNGVLDKSFMVDWSRYENTLLLTNGDDLRRINLVLMKRIDL